MSPGKRTTKDCGLPSFASSPLVPQDSVILFTMTIRLTMLFICCSLSTYTQEHIYLLLTWGNRSCPCVDMIWKGSSLYLAGLKEIYRNTSTKMELLLCSFATVTANHLASCWDWHYNNGHKELLTDSEHHHTTVQYIKGNNMKSELTHLLNKCSSCICAFY